jgi:ABC-type multidrug transport system ATPase subunit
MKLQTTGMDPVTRRHVWSVIEAAKLGRAIILTTHSMEEADILGDRIAIMARGELSCIGTPVWLKSRFGDGYIVNVRIQSDYASSDELPTDNGFPKTSIKEFFKQVIRTNLFYFCNPATLVFETNCMRCLL